MYIYIFENGRSVALNPLESFRTITLLFHSIPGFKIYFFSSLPVLTKTKKKKKGKETSIFFLSMEKIFQTHRKDKSIKVKHIQWKRMGTSCCRGIEANWEYKREMGGKDEDEMYVYKYEYYLEKIFGIDNNCTLINDSWNIAWFSG